MSEKYTRKSVEDLIVEKGLNSIVDLLNEQQFIINKLQDFCGQSDYENAKLRLENKKLKAENEQLRKELGDCEKFRYAVFERIGELNDE